MAATSADLPGTPADTRPDTVSVGQLLLVALCYSVAGWFALAIAIPPGYATPLFPSAGIALAAVLVYGRRALPAVLLGSLGVQAWHLFGTAHADAASFGTLVGIAFGIAAGATLQAAVGAWLVRRYVRWPLTLDGPNSISRLFGLGALLACTVNASVGSFSLWAGGQVQPGQIGMTWLTWWCGDGLGVVIATPVMLCFIGRPREAWRPRLTTVALPMVLVTLLLTAAILQVTRWDTQRGEARFERDAVGVIRAVDLRLRAHLDALDALHSVYVGSGEVDADEFQRATASWLAKLPGLQAIGWHERISRDGVAALEARAHAEGKTRYRVFERDAQLSAEDNEMIVMRYVEPAPGNDSALGVNVLSIRAAREAIARARMSDVAAATSGFRLTQEIGQQTGVAVYRAVRGRGEKPPAMDGIVFITLRMEDALATLTADAPGYLQICLLDAQAPAAGNRLAGPPGCALASGQSSPRLTHSSTLNFAGRAWEVRVQAPNAVPSDTAGPLASDNATAWLFSITGLAATGLMGALLLLVTGRTRRTEAAVAERTRELQHQIVERLHTEAALRESEQRFRSIFNSVPMGVVYTDLHSRIKQPNAAYCSMLGYREDELLQLSVVALTHRDDRHGDSAARNELVSGTLPFYRRRKRYITKAGTVLWVSVTVSLLRDENGEPHRMVGLIEDITEHLRLEEAEHARESAETANRAKSEFLSRMSHELRTPLNAMLGFAQLLDLDRSEALHERHRLWVNQIRQAGWHLLEMINEVLDLSRIESGNLNLQSAPLALEPLIAASMALVEPQAQARGITLVRSLTDHAPLQMLGDATRVKQILTNLLSNAVKYNHEGGEVRVATRTTTSSGGQSLIELDVTDTGLGIDAQQMRELFQPFNRLGRERSGTEGTGIGLVIAKLLAERMGGSLHVTSEPGHGSTFTLRLPLDTQATAPDADELPLEAGDEAHYNRRHVLYIEDNETNVEVMRGIFSLRPQVLLSIASTGLDGLAAVRTSRPDLVLLDMNLPDIDGMALLQHLQADETTADLAVIVVSADALPAQIEAALAAGAARYLTKPVAVDEMLAMIDELLSELVTRFG